MADRWQHIPIFYVDVQGFTTYDADTQRTIVRRLQDMSTEAARLFVPEGEVWSTWRRHGTGDGYYFFSLGPHPRRHCSMPCASMKPWRRIMSNTVRP